MNLLPWRKREAEPAPTTPLLALRTEMERLFERFFREPWGGWDWPLGLSGVWSPAVDVSENEQEVLVQAEVPGVDPKQIDVNISGNQLTISGEKKETAEKKDKDYYCSEIRCGAFRRMIPLPEGIDAEKVQAQYANGVLTIRIPKTRVAQPKRIEVKVD